MTARLPIAFLTALALHGGAGIWLGTLMTRPEAVPFVEAAPQLEMELIAPPEPVAATPAAPVSATDMAPEEPAPEPDPPEPVTPGTVTPPEPEPAPSKLDLPPAPELPPPPPKLQPKPDPARNKPERRPAQPKAANRPRETGPLSPRSDATPASGGGSPGGTPGARGRVTGITAGPVCVSRPAPAYPPALLDRHIGGTVVVEADIDSNGRVTATSLAGSSGQAALDRAALAGVRRWKFRPAQKAGSPVASRARVNVVFRPN